jgi:hypothetical protein
MSDAMRELANRTMKDPSFFGELLRDPEGATKDINLTDAERAALAGNTPERLRVLTTGVAELASCGSSPTCTETCTATCTVTFTSIVEDIMNPVVNPNVNQ